MRDGREHRTESLFEGLHRERVSSMLNVIDRGQLRNKKESQRVGLCIGVYSRGMKLGANLKWKLLDSSYSEQNIGTIIKVSIQDSS